MQNQGGKALLKRIKKKWQFYLFLLFPLIYIITFKYVPMVGAQIAFRDFNPALGIFRSPWVGLEFFKQFLGSYMFTRVVKNTITLSLYSLVAGFPIPILLALCLNCIKNVFLKKTIQNILYMPHFISTVVIVGIMTQMFNPVVGLYGAFSQALTGQIPPDLLSSPSAFPHLYVISGIWQSMGWNSILYFAALSNVDMSLHEAAMIDGASRFQRIVYIDFPSILPTIVIMLILNCGSIMSIGFEKAFLMQNDLNLTKSEIISTYVYKVGLGGTGGTNFSYATAIGIFNSVINMVLLIIVNKISQKLGETSLW